MEIKKISQSDYQLLLDLLNLCFFKKTGIAYKNLLPKYFLTYSDENVHLGIYEKGELIGATGLYIDQFISPYGRAKTACIGAVCVHPNYRKQGLSKFLMEEAIKLAKQVDVDFLYLTGQEDLYKRYGFYPAGKKYSILVRQDEMIRKESIYMLPISKESQVIEKCKKLYQSSPYRAIREKSYDPNWFYNCLLSWNSIPYAVYKNNEFIGYFTKGYKNVVFECLWKEGHQEEVIEASLQDNKEVWVGLDVPINGHEVDEGYSALVKILNLKKTKSYLGISYKTNELRDDELVQQIFTDWFIQTCDLG